MPAYQIATVTKVLGERPGIQRIEVELTHAQAGSEPANNRKDRAYVLTQQVGSVQLGDEVVINTTAVELQLGTGGWHFVHWNLTRGPFREPGDGHIMKVRYTSGQIDTGSTEELTPTSITSLHGTPVVTAGLHSQLGVVAAVIAHEQPKLRVGYVMTDGAALPLALSDLVAELIEKGLLAGTVTAGQAFGGDYEAVSLPSALLVAKEKLAADIIVVACGPGIVGTGSKYGFSGVEVADAIHHTKALDGRPVLCVRGSSGDARPRHQGVSHHTFTTLELLHTGVDVPVPDNNTVDSAAFGSQRYATVAEVAIGDVSQVLDRFGLRITTMGRDVSSDRLFFDLAAAAATHSISVLEQDPSSGK